MSRRVRIGIAALICSIVGGSSAWPAPFVLTSSSGDLVVGVRDDNGALNNAAFKGIEYFRHGSNSLLFVNGWSLQSEQGTFSFVSYIDNNMRGDLDIPMTVTSDGTTVTAVGTYSVNHPALPDPVEVQVTRTYTLVSDSVLRVTTTFDNQLAIPSNLRFGNSYRAVQGYDVPGNGFPGKFSDVVSADVDGQAVDVATASASDTPFSTGNPVDTVAIGSLNQNSVVEGGGTTIFTGSTLDSFFSSPDDDNGQFNFDNSNIGCDIALGAAGSETQSFTFTFDMAFGKTPDEAVQSFIDANVAPVIEVVIDVRPGSDENPLNLKSKGRLPVALLTTDDFDAFSVDPNTPRLGDPALIEGGAPGATAVKFTAEDVNDDGRPDVVFFFDVEDLVGTASVDSDTIALLFLGMNDDGILLTGTDSVSIKPSKK